jgi:hypothetical protein
MYKILKIKKLAHFTQSSGGQWLKCSYTHEGRKKSTFRDLVLSRKPQERLSKMHAFHKDLLILGYEASGETPSSGTSIRVQHIQ